MDHTIATITRHAARHAKGFPASPALAFAQSCLKAAASHEGEGRAKAAARVLRDAYLELVRVENDA